MTNRPTAAADERAAPSHRAPCRHRGLALPRRPRTARDLLVLAAAARRLARRGRAHRRARVRQSRLCLPASAARAAPAALAAGGDLAARRQRRGQDRPRRRRGRERAPVRDAAQGGSTRRFHRLRPHRGEPPEPRHPARPAAPRRAGHPPRPAGSRGPASGTLGRARGARDPLRRWRSAARSRQAATTGRRRDSGRPQLAPAQARSSGRASGAPRPRARPDPRRLGQRRWEALAGSIGRWLLDYGALLVAVRAVGSDSRACSCCSPS